MKKTIIQSNGHAGPGPRQKPMATASAQLNKTRNVFKTAESFGVEEVIDPRDTRSILTSLVPMAYDLEKTRLGPKARGMRP